MKFAGPPLAWTLAASLAAASLAGCVLDFHPDKVCGDGYVDVLAHEECDPGDPASYEDRCTAHGGVARDASACDPDTCTFVLAGCNLCGNGVLDEGEQCEATDLNGATCPGGAGLPTCRDDCTLDLSACVICGDGKLGGDEECDPGLNDIISGDPRACTTLVSPAGVTRPYGSGTSDRCTSKCLYDRSGCSYCMNNQLDGAEPVDFEHMITLEPEICDNHTAQPDMLDKHCRAVCGSNFSVECSYKCANDCRAFDVSAISQDELHCCTTRGEDCPYYPGTTDLKPGRVACCWADAHPGDEPCQEVNGGASSVCR